jgi:hypothetical protein
MYGQERGNAWAVFGKTASRTIFFLLTIVAFKLLIYLAFAWPQPRFNISSSSHQQSNESPVLDGRHDMFTPTL